MRPVRAQAAMPPNAYFETNYTFSAVPANSTAVMNVNIPGTNSKTNKFKVNRRIIVGLLFGQADLEAGIELSEYARIIFSAGHKVIEIRLTNDTASPITPAAKILQFLQF